MNYDTEKIKRVLDAETGKELKTWLLDKIDEVNHISNIDTGFNIFRAGTEVKVAKKTYEKLLEIFNEIITYTGHAKIKDQRDYYHDQYEEKKEN